MFDWDGTLVDSPQHIVDSLLAACADVGIAVPPAERARYIIGLGLKDALEYIIPPTHTFTVEVDGYRYFVSWRTPSFSHSGVALEELRRVPLEVEEEEAS